MKGVELHQAEGARMAHDVETTISHFIPSVELKGSRSDKLRKLDTLIVYLERLRRSLEGDAAHAGRDEDRGGYVERPMWPWFTAGTLLGALVVLLLLGARSFAL